MTVQPQWERELAAAKKRPHAYLAEKMRHCPRYNFDWFEEATAHLRSLGWTIKSPAEMDLNLGFDPDDEMDEEGVHAAMYRDFLALLDPKVDGIVLGPKWRDSEGAKAERQMAELVGKKVWHYVEGGEPVRCGWPHCDCASAKTIAAIQTSRNDGEVRVTDPNTGGQKGQKEARFDLLPVAPLTEVAELYGAGARKYADRNWEKSYAWSLSFAAMQRHAWKFWGGEDMDPETKKHHLASVVFHCCALMEFGRTHPEQDDRPAC